MKGSLDFRALDKVSQELWDSGERLLQAYRVEDTDEAHLRSLIDFGEFPHLAILLDMGCGFGELARVAADYRPDLTICSVNKSLVQLARAPEPKLYADMNDTRLSSSSYDGIVYAYSIGHVDAEDALAEAYRLLKPAGRLVIYDLEGPAEGLHEHAYEPFSEHEYLARMTGFRLVRRLTFSKRLRRDDLAEAFANYRPVLWVYER